jgi:hypothetical protein
MIVFVIGLPENTRAKTRANMLRKAKSPRTEMPVRGDFGLHGSDYLNIPGMPIAGVLTSSPNHFAYAVL